MKQNKLLKKRIIYLILIILWLSVIFIFSSQDADDSSNVSSGITAFIVNIYEKISMKDIDNEKVILMLAYPIRKLAHFTEYFILGGLVYLFINTYKIKYKLLMTICFCFICACCDEFHQTFVDGRVGNFIDVLIDTSGAMLSTIIMRLFDKK